MPRIFLCFLIIMQPVKVVLCCEQAIVPYKATSGAAGYELVSVNSYTIPPHGKELIATGIILEIPKLFYGRIAPRSGLACNHSIDVGAGIIDSDYRGEIFVLLFNHGDEEFKIKIGDRIAQLIFQSHRDPEINVLRDVSKLTRTERGSKGFGSTDQKQVTTTEFFKYD